MQQRGARKGQITIFIIFGIVIVAFAVLVYIFYPKIFSTFGFEIKSPSAYLQSCLENEILEKANILSLQGGSLNPEHYYLYEGNKIEYLCYSELPYAQCVMQQPMLKKHIESEIEKSIKSNAEKCLNDMKNSYLKKGYQVNLGKGNMSVELLPKRIVVLFNNSLILKKTETENYKTISFGINNNLYELISISNSILNWEARYGDSETTIYMNYYHDLKVEKKKQTDGTTIYILTDRNNGNKFQFASRSVVWPPGYGTS
mgnify:FL=1